MLKFGSHWQLGDARENLPDDAPEPNMQTSLLKTLCVLAALLPAVTAGAPDLPDRFYARLLLSQARIDMSDAVAMPAYIPQQAQSLCNLW